MSSGLCLEEHSGATNGMIIPLPRARLKSSSSLNTFDKCRGVMCLSPAAQTSPDFCSTCSRRDSRAEAIGTAACLDTRTSECSAFIRLRTLLTGKIILTLALPA